MPVLFQIGDPQPLSSPEQTETELWDVDSMRSACILVALEFFVLIHYCCTPPSELDVLRESLRNCCTPLQGMILETFSLRLRWSTDGGALLAVNSLQRPAHCASVLNREKWDAPLHVVGHRGAVTVVRFNPVMFENQEEGNTEPVTCFALGAQASKVLRQSCRLPGC